MNGIEESICTHLQHEGIGSVYERIVLSRFFRDLAARQGYGSVLEYGCAITRGHDNVAFLNRGMQVALVDDDIERIRKGWIFSQQPRFGAMEDAQPADLVWNFALIQLDARALDTMKLLAKKHILVLVPNILNVGTPFHLAYHLLTRTPCRHAEQGSIRARTKNGLLELLEERSIAVVESGYIDAPPIPDIGFSIRELKETMGWTRGAAGSNGQATDPVVVWERVEKMTRFEANLVVTRLKFLFGHHIYALGQAR